MAKKAAPPVRHFTAAGGLALDQTAFYLFVRTYVEQLPAEALPNLDRAYNEYKRALAASQNKGPAIEKAARLIFPEIFTPGD